MQIESIPAELRQAYGNRLAELESLHKNLEKLVGSRRKKKTSENYQKDFEQFEKFCERFSVAALPATPATVAYYIAYLANSPQENNGKPYKLASIRKKLTAITDTHTRHNHKNPVKSPLAEAALKGLSKTKGFSARQPEPLMVDEARRIVDGMGGAAREIRDKALILVGIAAMLRESELVNLKVEHLKFKHDRLIIHIPESKTDQAGEGDNVAIKRFVDERDQGSPSIYCPVQALENWLAYAGIDSGYVFRQVAKGGKIKSKHRGKAPELSLRAIDGIVAHYAKRHHLGAGYSGHSLRSGGATSAYAAGATEIEIMHQGRWKTLQTVKDRYIKKAKAYGKRNASARMGFGVPVS